MTLGHTVIGLFGQDESELLLLIFTGHGQKTFDLEPT